MPTQTLTYHGETGTQAYDGYAGFIIGQQYEISYTEVGDEEGEEKSKKQADQVVVQLPHAPGQTARMSSENFRKWFRK